HSDTLSQPSCPTRRSSDLQDRHMVIKAVLMACWQRPDQEPLVLHSDRGTQFTSGDYQRFLADHRILSSMSAVGHCADNAAAEGLDRKSTRLNSSHVKISYA